MAKPGGLKGSLLRNTDIMVAVGIVAVIVMLILPMPTFLLDFFLAVNLAISLVILMTVMYVPRAIDFSVFPTLILFTTIFRIALNVSSTRLILLEGKNFDGKIIQAFGEFVVGGNYVVGLVIFLILTAVQIMVITKGATRVSEVGARFKLDAMPQKQMEITSELQSGLITEEDAKIKKKELQKEVDFYGAMDGASKFVQGDVKVGVLITFINIIGGIIIGSVQQGLSMGDAASLFLKFTVGDGLVSQIPSLLVSVATGVIVTRSVSEGSFGEDTARELMENPKTLFIAAAFLGGIGLLPGFPMLTLWLLAAAFAGLGYYIKVNGPLFVMDKKDPKALKAEEEKNAAGKAQDDAFGLMVDPIELEIGFNLVPLVDPNQGGDLLERIKLIRKTIALELGLIVPPIRMRDNMRLAPSEYCIKIKGIEVGRGSLKIDRYLAIPPAVQDFPVIPGEEGIDPVFNKKATWVTESNRGEAEKLGYSVVDCTSVVATHLTEILRRHGFDLLGRQEVKKILDSIKQEYAAVTDEIFNNKIQLGDIQKVLQNLLKENVSIRNIVTILETIADFGSRTRNIDLITEKVRARLGKQIVQRILGDGDKLYVVTLSPELENALEQSLQETESGFISNVSPDMTQSLVEEVAHIMNKTRYQVVPVMVVSDRIRSLTREIVETRFPAIYAISYTELTLGQVKVEHLGSIKGLAVEGIA